MSQPGDPDELEADRVADRIMASSEYDSGKTGCSSCQVSGSSCTECEEKKVQRKGLPGAPGAQGAITLGLKGSGHPLTSSVRSFFEPQFGADLGNVRVHTDDSARDAARSIGARAFTFGSDVAFARNQFAPDTTEGKRLLAHELTHVVQQSRVVGSPGHGPLRDTVHRNATDEGAAQRTDPPDGPQLSEKESKAKEHLRALASIGRFYYETANTAQNAAERTTRLDVAHVIERPGPRTSFADLGQATAHASIGGLGSGAAVLKFDGLYYAVKLKPAGFRADRMYRFEPSAAMTSEVELATGEDGSIFKKFVNYEHDAGRLKAQGSAAVVGAPPSAAELRKAVGMSWGSNRGYYDPGQIASVGDQQAFVRSYFMARALEILDDNMRETDSLAETFAPQDGHGAEGTGVKPGAAALIDSSRKLLPAFEALLEAEAHLTRERVLVDRGHYFMNRSDIELRGVTKKWFEWRDTLDDQIARVRAAKSDILDAAPLLAHSVPAERIQTAGAPAKVVGGVVGGLLAPIPGAALVTQVLLSAVPSIGSAIDEAYDVASGDEKLRGENQVKGSLLNQPGTAENDEKIRKQFKDRLDAIRGAISRSKAEILGGELDPMSMSGLRIRVRNDMENIKGTSRDLEPSVEQLLATTAQKDIAWDLGILVLQVGLLFVPGGQFLSAVVGAATAAHDLGDAEKRWDVSQSTVNPAKALIDQQEAAYGRIMATINMVLAFVTLSAETAAALKNLETTTLAKEPRTPAAATPGVATSAERRAITSEISLVNALGETHELTIMTDGTICRWSYACMRIAESLERRAGTVAEPHVAEAADLVSKAKVLESNERMLFLEGLTKNQRATREQPLLQDAAALEQRMSQLEVQSGIPANRVPDGGLVAHEARGAHVLDRHVGKDDLDLWQRFTLANITPGPDGKSRISAWATLEDAESAVAQCIDGRNSQIQNYLAGGVSQKNLELYMQVGVTGNTWVKGESGATQVDGVLVVLKPDPSRPTGYRVVTAYPVGIPPYPPQ